MNSAATIQVTEHNSAANQTSRQRIQTGGRNLNRSTNVMPDRTSELSALSNHPIASEENQGTCTRPRSHCVAPIIKSATISNPPPPNTRTDATIFSNIVV